MDTTTDGFPETLKINHKLNEPITTQEHESFNSPPEPPTEFHRFQQLPVEIRELIYKQAMPAGDHLERYFGRSHRYNRTRRFPAVCFTSREESSVAVPIFIRHLDIRICCDATIKDLHRFFSVLPDRQVAYKAINRLTFNRTGKTCMLHQDFSYTYDLNVGPMVKDVYLMLACPNLRSLTVVVNSSTVTELGASWCFLGFSFTGASTDRSLPSRERVVKHIRFQRILKCKNLNRLKILVVGSFGGEVGPVVERMKEVTAWLEDSFERRNGTKMEVEFRTLDDGVEDEGEDDDDDGSSSGSDIFVYVPR